MYRESASGDEDFSVEQRTIGESDAPAMGDGLLAVVLAGHGIPATDYPRMRVGLLMMLEMAGKGVERIAPLRRWRDALEREVRAWPRTAENDPYKSMVESLAQDLSARLQCWAFAAYNEFCRPTIGEAIDQAIESGAQRVVVVPTMLVRGNSHTELEIQATVAAARVSQPGIQIIYAWPFEEKLIVSLLAKQVNAHLKAAV